MSKVSYRSITYEICTLCPEEIGLCGKELFGLLACRYSQFFPVMVGLDGNFFSF